MKSSELHKLISKELPYPLLTEEGEARFARVLQALPAREEAPLPQGNRRKPPPPRWKKGLWVSFACTAAALVFLVSLNAAFPAVAESIPGLGELFKTLNYKNAMGANAPGYHQLVQPVGRQGENGHCRIMVREAYSEGRYIFASLELSSEDAVINSAGFLSASFLYDEASYGYVKEYRAKVNGEETDLFREIVFEKKGDIFECATIITLPQEGRQGDLLQVELEISALRGLFPETVNRHETPPDVVMEEPLSLSFDVKVNTSYNVEGQPGTVENDVTFLEFESTPSFFNVTLEYPALGETLTEWGQMGWVEAYTENGTMLERNTDNTDWEPDPANPVAPGEKITQVTAFNGVPSGTKKVIVTLFNQSPPPDSGPRVYVDGSWLGACVLAEYTVDLETKSVVASTAFLEKGYELVPIGEYIQPFQQGIRFKDHVFVLPSAEVITENSSAEEEDPLFRFGFSVHFYGDTLEELPLEALFYQEGTQMATVSLVGFQERREQREERYWAEETESYTIGQYEPAQWEYEGGFPASIKCEYTVTQYLPDLQADLTAWDHRQLDWQLRNTETGEIIYDSMLPPVTRYAVP